MNYKIVDSFISETHYAFIKGYGNQPFALYMVIFEIDGTTQFQVIANDNGENAFSIPMNGAFTIPQLPKQGLAFGTDPRGRIVEYEIIEATPKKMISVFKRFFRNLFFYKPE